MATKDPKNPASSAANPDPKTSETDAGSNTSQLDTLNAKREQGGDPSPEQLAAAAQQGGKVDPAEGSVKAGTTVMPDANRENVQGSGLKLGDTYALTYLIKGPALVDPSTGDEYEFNSPVEAELTSFMQGQVMAGSVRAEEVGA